MLVLPRGKTFSSSQQPKLSKLGPFRLTNIHGLAASNRAFAAVDVEGHVITWGDAAYGGDSSKVKERCLDPEKP